MLKEESFEWQEETRKTLRIFIRSTLGQKMFSKEGYDQLMRLG